jgi:GT2 family glycosyltransferase
VLSAQLANPDSKRIFLSPNDSYPQHVVTAVIVAHDGAGWLAHGLDALSNQTKPVQRVVAVDTGSRDRSGSVLAAKLGQGCVFGMDRSTGYAAAVRRAVQHKAASAPVPGGSQGRAGNGDQVEWLWLLHDDCEPAPDALEQLLRGAAETQSAAVLGPKLMDWTHRDVIGEAGLTLDTVGRRITGVEPGEVDQGQHDGDRDSLAVSSAGMLVRRDVWEHVGGFDPAMTLFGEDIDFCWRVHAAGYRVRVITDAVVYHARAATKGRRPVSVGRRARLLDRRNALVTLLGNLPLGQLFVSLVGNLVLSFLRTVFYLVAKRPSAALDESAAVLGVVGHPIRLAKIRHRRAAGRRQAYGRLRGDLPPGRSLRRAAEFAAMVMSRSSEEDVAGVRHATDDPTDDEWLLTDRGFLQRVLTRPGVLVVLGLVAVAIAAERSIIASGTLGGGALLPAWEGASGLWSQFLQPFHPTGVGSVSSGLPYVGILAVLATVLGGKPWLAIDLLLLGSVPMAGITAILALRKVTKSVPVRVWAAASYALLPVAFGAIAAGRLGSAVAFVVIPLVGLLAGRMFSESPKLARRAAWATGLVIAVGAAFEPLLWLLALAGAALAAITLYRARRGLLANLAIAALTPLVLLMPWLFPLLQHPSLLLLEAAGVQRPGLAATHLPAKSLLLLSPGGPGLPPYWVSGALVLTALAALLASKRRRLVISGWSVALLGLAAGVAVSRVTITPPGGRPMTPWAGVPLAVAAAGLLLAAAAAASDFGTRHAPVGRKRRQAPGLRRIPVALLAAAALSAPLLAAGFWLLHGIDGPLAPASGEIVPPSLVSQMQAGGRQLRTLVLTTSGGHISYLLLRGGSPQLSDPGLTQIHAANTALDAAVATLVAPGGGGAANQSQLLARFDIGFVLMPAPVSTQLAGVLDGVAGLASLSTAQGFDLWRLTDVPSRVSVVEPKGAVVPVPAGPVGVSAAAPAAGGTLELAEPVGGWSASLNGHPLTPVASPAGSWGQAFTLPPGGGTLTVSRNGFVHEMLELLELLAFVVVGGLALPGVRTAAEIEAASANADEAVEELADVPADEAAMAGVGAASALAVRESVGAGNDRPAASSGGRGIVDAGGRTVAGAGRRAAVEDTGGHRTRPTRSGGSHAATDATRRGDGPNPEARPADDRGVGRSRKGRKASARQGSARDESARNESARNESARNESARNESPRKDRRRAGRLGLPSRDRGAAGRAAAAGGAAGAAAATAGSAAARSAATGAARVAAAGGVAGPPPGGSVAWPAGRPKSRYIDGPPDSSRAAGPRSPSGTPYEEPPHRGASSPPVPGYGARSPSGARYQEDAASYEPDGYREVPSHAYGPGQGYGNDDPYDRDAGYRQGGYEGERQSRPQPPARTDWQDSGWHNSPAAHGQGSIEPGQHPPGSGWPEPPPQQGWSGDYEQQASPPGYPADGRAGGRGSSWPVPEQQPWPDQDDELEALPSAGEVHHDWPGREDRTGRSWPAPGRDAEGETW